jgi:hypothetical protein
VKREVKFSVYLIFPHTFFTRYFEVAKKKSRKGKTHSERKRPGFILYNKKFISEVRKIEEKSEKAAEI